MTFKLFEEEMAKVNARITWLEQRVEELEAQVDFLSSSDARRCIEEAIDESEEDPCVNVIKPITEPEDHAC